MHEMSELEAPEKPSSNPTIAFLAILTLCYLVSFAGAEGAMRGLRDWYPIVAKPSWAPPVGVFIPLGTVLYGTLAIALFLLSQAKRRPRATTMALAYSQLVLSGVWSWVFFGLHNLKVSLGVAVVVWLVLAAAIAACAKGRPQAALWMIPQWIWLSFALSLNFAIMRLSH